MTAPSAVSAAKRAAIEEMVAASGTVEVGRGLYFRAARAGISRREVNRALDALEARGRIVIYSGGGRVVARLVGDGGER